MFSAHIEKISYKTSDVELEVRFVRSMVMMESQRKHLLVLF
jgi:hypothetical protein